MQCQFARWARLLASGLLLICGAGATSVPQLSFEELVDHSNLIVSGRVTRTWTDWDSDRKFIWTHYELGISAMHKGSPGSSVVVSEVGGVVGNRRMTVAGTVTYQPGQRVLVFLARMPNGYLRTTGWGQGKYSVDEKNNLHSASSFRSVEIVSSGRVAGTPIRSLEGMSAAQLHQIVAARLRSQPQTQGGIR